MAAPLHVNDTPVLIADDGEMLQVRALLRDQDLDFAELGSDDQPATIDLLISNPRGALGLSGRRVCAAVHIVVADELTRTMRQQLQRSSADFIVEGPVDPQALKLLIRHALYRGPERRNASRVPLGVEVKIKSGWRQRRATLLQLSARGCGVAIMGELEGDDLTLRLPPEYCDGRKIDLPVCVLEDMGSSEGEHVVALGFTRLPADARAVLDKAMRTAAGTIGRIKPSRTVAAPPRRPTKVDGPAPTPSPAPIPERAAAPGTQPEPRLDNDDRREAERYHYRRRLLGTAHGQAQVLIGRDLSVGGMRVNREPGLGVGDELKLALHGGGQKVLVRARVVRDDADGVGVCFVDLTEKTREGLQAILDSLSILGRARTPDGERPGVVLGEVLGDDAED